jgi:hypothetical protein
MVAWVVFEVHTWSLAKEHSLERKFSGSIILDTVTVMVHIRLATSRFVRRDMDALLAEGTVGSLTW